MAKKTKKESKRERREQEAAERAALEAERQKRLRWMRIAVAVIPLVAAGAGFGVWGLTDDARLGGLIGLVGVAIWILTLLAMIGASVPPRERTRASSIDFGNKR